MCARVLLFLIFTLKAVYGESDDITPTLRYYYTNLEKYAELPIDRAQEIFNIDWYNSSRPTVVFAHGFTGRPSGPAVSAVIQAYLEEDQSNVVLLNWEHMAAHIQPSLANSYTGWAAPNARLLGARFAETLQNLSSVGFDLNRTHLVGHSLGAQIFGIAGNQLAQKGIQLPWITGLDPAGVGFETRPLLSRLNPNSARFVSVIHTDPNRYGFSRALGTVDFWPNYRNVGLVRQPGCNSGPHPMFSKEDLCSHNRCWELLVDSIKRPGFLLGSYARNYRVWKNYSKKDRLGVTMEFGKHYEKVLSGNYYFTTRDVSPYGLGEDGL